jgi:nitrogen regulatory protein PII
MKRIEVIVRPQYLQNVLDSLDGIQFPGFIAQKTLEPNPQTKVHLPVEDNVLDQAVGAIATAFQKYKIEDGKLFIYPNANTARMGSDVKGNKAVLTGKEFIRKELVLSGHF